MIQLSSPLIVYTHFLHSIILHFIFFLDTRMSRLAIPLHTVVNYKYRSRASTILTHHWLWALAKSNHILDLDHFATET